MVSCIIVLVIASILVFEGEIVFTLIFVFYSLYAGYIFICTLQKKKAQYSTLFKRFFIIFCLFYFLFFIPISPTIHMDPILFMRIRGVGYLYKLKDLMILETFLVFGLMQFIPLQQPLLDLTISNGYGGNIFILVKGIFMLILRCVYFALLAIFTAITWNGG